MIEQNSNIDNPFCRGAAVFIIENEWEQYFRERILELIEMIKPSLKDISAKTLEDSFAILKDAVQRVIPDQNYRKKESTAVFRVSMLGLEDAMRLFLEAYIKEKDLYHHIRKNPKGSRDSIDSLIFVMYDSLDSERNSKMVLDGGVYDVDREKLRFGYPAVTRITIYN